MKQNNLNDLLLFSGSFISLFVGLLAAFIPNLAFITVYSYFMDASNPLMGLPYVGYQPLILASHIYTARLVMAAVGGLIGLFALLRKKMPYLGVVAISVSGLALILPSFNDTRITIPEARLFDVPWIGSLIVIIGISLMFLGLTLKKGHLPKASFLSLVLVVVANSILPLFAVLNYLPWSIFGATISYSVLLIDFLSFVGILLMVWGVLKSNARSKLHDSL